MHESDGIKLTSLRLEYQSRHLACEEDRGEVAVSLVEHGANLDAMNKVIVLKEMKDGISLPIIHRFFSTSFRANFLFSYDENTDTA